MTRPFPMPLQTHIRSPLSLVGRTNIPLASGEGSEGGTILFFDFLSQAKLRSARLDPLELIRPRQVENGKLLLSRGRRLSSFQDNPRVDVSPKGDQQLSR